MEELTKLLTTKLGLPEEVSRKAVELILTQIKGNLPAPVAGQIEKLIAGKAGLADLSKLPQGSGGLLDKLGGLMGKK